MRPAYICALFLAVVIAAPSFGANVIRFSSESVATRVELGEVHFAFRVKPVGPGENVAAQIFLHRAGHASWDSYNAGATPSGGDFKIYALYPGMVDTIAFALDLPPGHYDGYRLMLFASPDGVHPDFAKVVYDSAADPNKGVRIDFTVTSTLSPVRGPELTYAPVPDAKPNGSGTYTVTIPAKIKMPIDYAAPDDGLWAMAKGSAGFSQVWAPLKDSVTSGDPKEPYKAVQVTFVLKNVKPGLYATQFGLFRSTWGNPLQWVYPGLEFEVGGAGWERRATSKPERVGFERGRFVAASTGRPVSLYPGDPAAQRAAAFVRGADYGNALDWTDEPELDDPGYFAMLGEIGCRFVRILFSPDKYLQQALYRHVVDQVVQNVWQANEYPLICPQDLPAGSSLSQRDDLGEAVCRKMAQTYRDEPVWIEVCNEPHEFGTWGAWKPVATRYVKAIRAIDPKAFVVVPFEGYSKSGAGAARSPITDVHVNFYDGHAYVAPAQVESDFGPATRAGLPVLIGEYGGGAPYLAQMDRAFQQMRPQPAALAAWAFTVKGQDSLPLVASVSGASIRFTPAGQSVADAYQAWLHGRGA